jgi:TrmH family RNA methyltransferase
MMKRIESRENPFYKSVSALQQARESRLRRLVFLEGLRLCRDAIQSGVPVRAALFSDRAALSAVGREILDHLPSETDLYVLPDRLFDGLCATENPQGVALVCDSPLIEQPAGPPSPRGLYLVADQIQDPGNLGNMIRIADAFAFDALIVTEGSVYPFHGKVLRAAMGSCFHIPLLALPDLAAVATWLATAPVPVSLLAADPGDPADPKTGSEPDPTPNLAAWPSKWPIPAALAIGNEARGLSPDALRICTQRVAIPMPGQAESLNAATAAAILCFQLMLARMADCPPAGRGSLT